MQNLRYPRAAPQWGQSVYVHRATPPRKFGFVAGDSCYACPSQSQHHKISGALDILVSRKLDPQSTSPTRDALRRDASRHARFVRARDIVVEKVAFACSARATTLLAQSAHGPQRELKQSFRRFWLENPVLIVTNGIAFYQLLVRADCNK